MERVSFCELLADERRGFKLTFGTEHGQTFSIDAAPQAVAAPEEEELGPVRLSELEDNFAVGIVDLAMLAVQTDAPDLDRTVWGMVTDRGEGDPQCGERRCGVAGGVLRDGGPPGGQIQRKRWQAFSFKKAPNSPSESM